MAKEPPLSSTFTATLAVVGGLVSWAATARVTGAVLPEPVAITVAVVLGVVVMLGVPIPLRRPDLVVLLTISVGGLVTLIGFVTQLDTLGAGLTLAIYLPVATLVGLLAWVLHRFVVPALTRPRPPRE